MRGLTSEFGMGSGISLSLMPPSIVIYQVLIHLRLSPRFTYNKQRLKIHSPNLKRLALYLAPRFRVPKGMCFFLQFLKKVVKPVDLLVLVSLTHYCAYTPNLSTT